MKALAVVLGIILIILAILAFTGALNLHSRALGLDGAHHAKHGIIYIVLGLLCFVWARMSSGTTVTSSR